MLRRAILFSLLCLSGFAAAQSGLLADEKVAGQRAQLRAAPAGEGATGPLAALAPVASRVDIARFLQPAWGTGAIPGEDADHDTGAFRFVCAPGQLSYDDPIIYAGRPGASHLHQFFGNTGANAGSTYASLRTTGESTCNNILNRSAYWIPAMMNGHGKVVRPDYLQVYYKRMPTDDPRCRTLARACVQLPRGLRYVFGYNMQDPLRSAPVTQRWWACDGPGGPAGQRPTITAAASGCPVGARLGGVVSAPDCWNGRDLDSPDHRSHMAYRVQDGRGHATCPSSHPFIIPQFTLGAWYTNDGSAGDWYLSSDRMPGTAAAEPGATLHSDWFGAWEDGVLAAWHAGCIDKRLSCSGGDLGDGRQMTQLKGYDFPHRTVLVDPPPAPAEVEHAGHRMAGR